MPDDQSSDDALDEALCGTFPASDPVALSPGRAARNPGAVATRTPPQPVRVTWAELPLCCPRPDQALWNSHPRVYLPIEDSGRERCPYCGTVYVLETAGSGERVYPNLRLERLHAEAVQRQDPNSAGAPVADKSPNTG